MSASTYTDHFKRNVTDKYTIYNSLFAALPFSGIANVGAFLPILLQDCIDGYKAGKSPMEIIDQFFEKRTTLLSEADKMDRLFKSVQYIERQVVLFDAIEDAAFDSVNNVEGPGSLKWLYNEAAFAGKTQALKNKLRRFRVRVVLTAHPTQFYPGSVLGIIHDMSEAISKNDFHTINLYIQQLGITPFFNKKQPTPYDEALNLMWYLENILYYSIGNIYNFIVRDIFDGDFDSANPFIELGFWPGGDRDGNPFVNAATTIRVAEALRSAIIVCYYRDVRKLKRRLTFSGVDSMIHNLEERLYQNVFQPKECNQVTHQELLQQLDDIRNLIISKHHSLFLGRLDSLIHKVKIFGTHFASLDIRQDSRIHGHVLQQVNTELKAKSLHPVLPDNYDSLSETDKIGILTALHGRIDPLLFEDTITKDTLESMYAISTIQQLNGEPGCHRYIISNCQSVLNIIEVYALLRLCGWEEEKMTIDIIPLFETIDDLKEAEHIMDQLYQLPFYRTHLKRRNREQTIMLGFSDGTKDGGYLQANWSIYTAKENLTAISRKHNIKARFFDGRGGPPSRGGGKTNRFYASLGNNIENEEIQITIQGQTITSNFGTIQTSQYNLEQLLSAGASNELFADSRPQLSLHDRFLLDELGRISYESYQAFKKHPKFLAYLQQFSPLNYYSKSNIASRPAKRGGSGGLRFEDLRAVPFVGSWSQLKQNVPGYFGVGTALKQMKEKGLWDDVKAMFRNVPFFKTLIDNSMMSMLKSSFALTQYIRNDQEYGEIWQLIKDEFDLSCNMVLELAGTASLMEDDKTGKASIQMRDNIVLPLLTIQQYALHNLHASDDDERKAIYEKLVTRSMFGIINAARNSA
ncbi:phosphoenolpyruvate carboxylase [Sediminibacterium ginsengisoli]|uniref:Phosphoenolpyruvate carboxylase n=1 Tax=Sediminibacterium ginsengisoli TaxID=413434 RepID=A0A1T4NNB6_9BACT|nr:phosphoenolpyruvate carboxylase [Sediminibacterium ginsengisoli]SJZ80692.1 Phosphoenolpyruvate carboxylase, type 1 [Sediminibacterium ginsengisoli]